MSRTGRREGRKLNVKRIIASSIIGSFILASIPFFGAACGTYHTSVPGVIHLMLTSIAFWEKTWWGLLLLIGLASIFTVPAAYRYYKLKAQYRSWTTRVFAVIEVFFIPMLIVAAIFGGEDDNNRRNDHYDEEVW